MQNDLWTGIRGIFGRRSARYAEVGSLRRQRRSVFVVATIVATSCLLLSACGTATARTAAVTAKALPLREDSDPYTTISYNPFNPNFVDQGNPNTFLPLGITNDNGSAFKPILATNWKLTRHSITFYLHKDAKWQNGSPLTSQDLTTTLLLDGEQLNGEWASITGLSTLGQHAVVVHLQPWAVPKNVLIDLDGTVVVPASIYGRFLVPHAESDILTYWKLYNSLAPTQASMNAAAASPGYKAIEAASTKLTKFAPSSLVGDGPYKLVHASFSGLDYVKWNGFYDASAIHVPQIDIIPMTTSDVYGALVSHRLDEETTNSYTDPEVKKLNVTPDVRYVMVRMPMVDRALIFHETDYPFNMVGVRQALAYLINRPKLSQLQMGGTLLQNPPVERPTGLPHPMAEEYLTKSQFDSLNPYSYNPTKAADILKGLGFTKRSGKWYTPKGTLFSFTLYEPAGHASFEADGIHLSRVFSSFGIPVSVSTPQYSIFFTDLEDGKYAVGEGWANWASPEPLAHLDAIFAGMNYPLYYDGKGQCKSCTSELALNPMQNVPGLGHVNIETTLNTEENEAPPAKWGQLVWDWARFFNKTMPDIPLYTNSEHNVVETTRYTWPAPSSWPWTFDSLPTYFELWGYMKPR